MAITNFTEADVSWGFCGWFDTALDAAKRSWQGQNSTWIGYITGTDARLSCGTTGLTLPYYVSVDGGAESNPTLSGGWVQLFSGLSDTAHLVSIRCSATYAPRWNWTFTSGTFIEVTGAAPAIGQGSDLGTSWVVNDPLFPGLSSINISTTANAATITPAVNYLYFYTYYAQGGAIKFVAKCTDIWTYGGFNEFYLGIDGGDLTLVTVGSVTAYGVWKKIATGLDDTQNHTYMIVPSKNAATIQANFGVMIGGPSATFGTLPPQKVLFQVGDSITAGNNAATVGSGAIDTYKYCQSLGYMPMAGGRGGITTEGAVTDWATLITPTMALTPDYVVITLGRNGAAGASFISAYETIITNSLALGASKVLCRRVVPDNFSDRKSVV